MSMTNWTCGTTRADRFETRDAARAPTGRTRWPSASPCPRGCRMRGRRVPPTARRQRVWGGMPRDPGLGAGSGCGSVGRATAGPDGRTRVRASGGVRPSAPPLIYINTGQHCGGPRNGTGKQQCHLGTLGPVGPRRVMLPARRQAGRGGWEGSGGRVPPPARR